MLKLRNNAFVGTIDFPRKIVESSRSFGPEPNSEGDASAIRIIQCLSVSNRVKCYLTSAPLKDAER